LFKINAVSKIGDAHMSITFVLLVVKFVLYPDALSMDCVIFYKWYLLCARLICVLPQTFLLFRQ